MNSNRDPFAVTPGALFFLHVEDNLEDAELTRSALDAEWPGCQILRVETREDFLKV